MKKLLVLLLTIAILMGMVVVATSCKKPTTPTYEIALITDKGSIDDKSFNQGAWEGVVQYAEEKNISHKYYKPLEVTTDAYVETIDLAVQGGAKVIVCPGFLFEPAIFRAQNDYPDVKFILLDGFPNNQDYEGDFKSEIKDNVYSVFYAEEQSGFLAGYAAVKDGYRKLGFMGGMAVPAVIRFGYGFVQGANYAANELTLADDAIEVKYLYTGDFKATPEVRARAATWYTGGTEVIFACGGAVGDSVMAAAEAGTNKKVIGVDVDQASESATVITSAMKMLKKSVYDALTKNYENKFPGGESQTLAADVGGIGLPMGTSKFTTFNQAQYDAIFNKLKADEIAITKDIKEDKSVILTDLVVPKVKLISEEFTAE